MRSLQQILFRAAAHPGTPWALATLVRTSGSTYRQPGAMLIAGADGVPTGVLSGGCLEEEIARQGTEVIRTGVSKLLEYDTRKYFGCEGMVEVFVERLPEDSTLLAQIGALMKQRVSRALCTEFEGERRGTYLLAPGDMALQGEGRLIRDLPLPIRLLVFGNGPEIEPLQALSAPLGWEVFVFPRPEACPDDIGGDPQTAGLIVNHHFGRDLASLDRLVSLNLPYLGLLGPRKRNSRLLAQWLDLRSSPPDLSALHAPAGLDIGSEAPEEIALSIVAEITAVLAGRQAGFLRDRAGARIHQSGARAA